MLVNYWNYYVFTGPIPHLVVRSWRSKLGQTNNRVVRGLQVGEGLAQEVLQSGHIRQREVVRRCERLGSNKSQAEDKTPEQPCADMLTVFIYHQTEELWIYVMITVRFLLWRCIFIHFNNVSSLDAGLAKRRAS